MSKLAALLPALLFAYAGDDLPVLSKDAGRFLEKVVTVSGFVYGTHKTSSHVILHFEKDHPKHFSVWIHKRRLKRFPPNVEDYFMRKEVLVRGRVKEIDGAPVIFVTDRSQIWLVGESFPK